MKIPALIATVAAIGLAAVVSAQGAFRVPHTPWGDPDISGLFTSDDELGVPFERPAQFGTRRLVTDEEYAQRQTAWQIRRFEGLCESSSQWFGHVPQAEER